MKTIVTLIFLVLSTLLLAQEKNEKKVNLADFQLSNVTSPAFLLLDETPTLVYTPENLRALMIHSLQNLGENLSIEITPFLLRKKTNKTYYDYIGINHTTNGNTALARSTSEITQKPCAKAWRDFTISFAYVNKEFNKLGSEKKVFSLGARTTFFKWYNKTRKMKIYNAAIGRAEKLKNVRAPISVIKQGNDAIKKYIKEQYKEISKTDTAFNKTVKPMFQIDGALGYGVLFRENNIQSKTLKRFGSWITTNLSLCVFNKKGKTKKNNYLNVFAVGRYVEDGFLLNTDGTANTMYYRDFGGKAELEIGDFSFGYEYIKRNGSIDSYRSLGNIKYVLGKNISITGGFGKDFNETDNLITLFGINWGLNFGSKELKL